MSPHGEISINGNLLEATQFEIEKDKLTFLGRGADIVGAG